MREKSLVVIFDIIADTMNFNRKITVDNAAK